RAASDVASLEFTADRDGDGVFETIVGDSVPLGATVTFKLHARDAAGGKLELVRNGQVAQQWSISSSDFEVTFTDTPAAKSWYRVNCWERVDMSVPYASTLRGLVLGTVDISWLQSLLSTGIGSSLGHFFGQVQDIIDTGGPAALWLLVFGDRMGMKIAPLPTHYPRLEPSKAVSQIINCCVNDPDYCPGVLTSAIWVE
ncbi:MAG TPA: hypothetical protein VHF22_10715, partial [Planctomycetota bacterium]|nr:hypothetical protein [Planctomycetota bacterium]